MFMVCSDRLVNKKNEYFIAYYNGSSNLFGKKKGAGNCRQTVETRWP